MLADFLYHTFCLGWCSAAEHIQRGEADLMLAGGAEAAVIPSGVGGFIACRALSSRNEDPRKASRPWDKDRDGFVMGEGAGTVCLLACACLPVSVCLSVCLSVATSVVTVDL